MATRKKDPMPLDTVRRKLSKHGSDIDALKAGVLDLQSRMAKAETALGILAKGEMPPNVERVGTRDETRSDEG